MRRTLALCFALLSAALLFAPGCAALSVHRAPAAAASSSVSARAFTDLVDADAAQSVLGVVTALPSSCPVPASLSHTHPDSVQLSSLDPAVAAALAHADAPQDPAASVNAASLLEVLAQKHSELRSAVYAADPAVVAQLSLHPAVHSAVDASRHSALVHDAVTEGWRVSSAYGSSGPSSVHRRGPEEAATMQSVLGSSLAAVNSRTVTLVSPSSGREAVFSLSAFLDVFAVSELVHYTQVLTGPLAAAPSWTAVSLDTLPVFASGWGCSSDKYVVLSELYSALLAAVGEREDVDVVWTETVSVAPTGVAHDGFGAVRDVYSHPLVAWTDAVPSEYAAGVARVTAEAADAEDGYTLNEIALGQILLWVTIIMLLSLFAAIKCAMDLDNGPKDSLLFMSTGQKSKID